LPNHSAKVKSTDALIDFRACLVKQCEEYSFAIQSGKSDIRKMQHWLKHEQAPYLKKLLEKCQETLSRTKIELLRKKNVVSTKTNSCIDEKRALEKAKKHFEEVQDKLRNLKKWIIQLEKDALDFNGQIQGLTTVVDTTLPKAQSRLEQMVLSIENYQNASSPQSQTNTTSKNKQIALPNSAIEITVELAKSLRSKTPTLQQRLNCIENNTISFRDSILSNIDYNMLDFTYHKQSYLPSNKIIVDTNTVFSSPIYFERVTTAPESNDSGWYIGNINEALEPLLASTSVGDIQYDYPNIESLFSMPVGTIIILSRHGIDMILDLNNNILLDNGDA